MDNKDVKKLAELARIDISPKEENTLLVDLSSILKYVSELQDLKPEKALKSDSVGDLYNVMRDDLDVDEQGIFREDILNEAPNREGNYIKVKKIL